MSKLKAQELTTSQSQSNIEYIIPAYYQVLHIWAKNLDSLTSFHTIILIINIFLIYAIIATLRFHRVVF